MERRDVHTLLDEVAKGTLSVDEAAARLANQPFVDLGYAKPDLHRGLRQGTSEVIYGAGKTADQIAGILAALVGAGETRVMVSRLSAEKECELRRLLDPKIAAGFTYHASCSMGVYGAPPEADGNAYVLVICAGTSDLYAAEEAAITAEMLGSRVVRVYDAGVAGLHRLLAHLDDIAGASAIVAVAGMEGALASVVGGLAACPVIACPTSVGYGASLEGVAALLAMLNSCASGVSVVNIDNGFGAGYQAALIDHACCAHEGD